MVRSAAIPLLFLSVFASAEDLPPGRWVEIARDPLGARRGSALRYAPEQDVFLLWGFMTPDSNLPQENPLMAAPEYDMVAFQPARRRWENFLPPQWEKEASLPLAYLPRTYSALTTGSERTVMRNSTEDAPAVPRPDLNIVFDQVAYRPANGSLYYFTGGLTAQFDIARRRWRDLRPAHSPPPVLGGSLAYDPLHDELILFGGGHVAERGPDGKVRGYTGTWVYSIKDNDWAPLRLAVEPPPRMVTRMVTDTRRNALIVFGGDSQRYYLGDTWIFDLRTRAWRESKAPGPPPRAGHFTVYDPDTARVLIGGGYNRSDLIDMWTYDPAADRWARVEGETPAGFYLSADLAAEKRLLVLITATRTPGDRMKCNVIFPVRTTYGYNLGRQLQESDAAAIRHAPMPKYAPEASPPGAAPGAIPPMQWVALDHPGRAAPVRTWGSAAFDTKRSRILYWGGGHCGYEGSDTDAYDVATHTWIPEPTPPSYPERLWNHASRLAGVTFDGEPFTDHGRRIYAYDAVGDRMILVKPVRLTTGYEPDWLRTYPARKAAAPDAVVQTPSSYTKFVTFAYDLGSRKWSVLGPAPEGLDTLVDTPLGVMGVPVNWPARLNDAGYQIPYDPRKKEDTGVYLLRGVNWERLSRPGPSPQYLYEMTSLAFDTRRNQLILHGAGPHRRDLWTFDVATRRWREHQPSGEAPPACLREAVYLPKQDVFLTYGAGLWEYSPAKDAWRRAPVPDPQLRAGQNRAMVYDPKRGLVFLVLGGSGDDGRASVFALRYP